MSQKRKTYEPKIEEYLQAVRVQSLTCKADKKPALTIAEKLFKAGKMERTMFEYIKYVS